jgi:hypothetical protein
MPLRAITIENLLLDKGYIIAVISKDYQIYEVYEELVFPTQRHDAVVAYGAVERDADNTFRLNYFTPITHHSDRRDNLAFPWFLHRNGKAQIEAAYRRASVDEIKQLRKLVLCNRICSQENCRWRHEADKGDFKLLTTCLKTIKNDKMRLNQLLF